MAQKVSLELENQPAHPCPGDMPAPAVCSGAEAGLVQRLDFGGSNVPLRDRSPKAPWGVRKVLAPMAPKFSNGDLATDGLYS